MNKYLWVLVLVTMGSQAQELPNRLIDYGQFQQNVASVAKIRRQNRLSEAQFIALAQQPGTVILDARSERMFNRLHIDGAVNLSFPDFTEHELAKVIPTKDSKILIYCNNNFTNAPASFPAKTPAASLNLHTYNALHSYGYTQIYELGPLLDASATAITLVGSERALH